MKKLVIIRSLTGNAAAYARRHLRRMVWFDNVDHLLTAIRAGARPQAMAVDGGLTAGLNLGPLVSGFGYVTEVRSVP